MIKTKQAILEEFEKDFFNKKFVGENKAKNACDYFKDFLSKALDKQREQIYSNEWKKIERELLEKQREEIVEEIKKMEKDSPTIEQIDIEDTKSVIYNKALEDIIKRIKKLNYDD